MTETAIHSRIRFRTVLLYLIALALLIASQGCLAKQIEPVIEPPLFFDVPDSINQLPDTTG